jgi:hypothetical protein
VRDRAGNPIERLTAADFRITTRWPGAAADDIGAAILEALVDTREMYATSAAE